MTSEFKSHRSYQDFAFSVGRCWRYLRTDDDDSFIEAVLATSHGKGQEVPAGETLWRAQVGYALHKLDKVEVPLSPERMKPPADWLLEGRAPEGRINPKGIPFLYAATHMQTAIGEVRPSLGALVSVVNLRTSRGIRLINCTTDEEKIRNIVYFKEPEAEERTQAVWRDMDRAFSQPVIDSDNRADYAATQFIAELFRQNGFDGIAYRSAFGPGHNIALFDLNSADVAPDPGPQLVEVTGLSLTYSRR
jgi:RES domain-containing protein